MINQTQKNNEVIINHFAQEKISFEKVIDWFENLSLEEKKEVLNLTRLFLEQTHPSDLILEDGINKIPLKPTMTPITLLKTYNLKIALDKIINLPNTELKKSFISLLTIFKVADTERRNTDCKNGCSHTWHNL
ncbi:hypothetical protein HC174_16420 [Salinimicrobium sp. CDJ15-81-2]|nr:hypothetical protein [Salinimicrobium nanhaiense]